MNVFLDIETIPNQSEGALENFMDSIVVKCPHKTKEPIGKDLGMSASDIKFTGRNELELMWIEKFGDDQKKIQAEEKWLKTSFDGAQGEVISIAWAVNNKETSSISRSNYSQRELIFIALEQIEMDANKRPPYFIGHNIRFDLKFLFRRCVILGIKPPFALPFNGRHGNDFYCTCEAWEGFNGRISQDNLCKILGIEGKPGDIDGSKVFDYYKKGDIESIESYNIDDVEKVRKIYNRLNFK